MRFHAAVLAVMIAGVAADAHATPLAIELSPSVTNPASPQMGEHLSFQSVIRNDGATPVEGVIAWLSLVQTDKGKEQPVDLEDWSAHKAVTVPTLAPGQTVQTDWPMRLIQAGNYRVVISAVSRTSAGLAASPFADFVVREKPVVESTRVLPVAFGLPGLLTLLLLLRWRSR
jgi:hypothetical protein